MHISTRDNLMGFFSSSRVTGVHVQLSLHRSHPQYHRIINRECHYPTQIRLILARGLGSEDQAPGQLIVSPDSKQCSPQVPQYPLCPEVGIAAAPARYLVQSGFLAPQHNTPTLECFPMSYVFECLSVMASPSRAFPPSCIRTRTPYSLRP